MYLAAMIQIPHALSGFIEGANGPTTLDADKILVSNGIFVVPDMVANAGGVVVSYLEWVHGLQAFFWNEGEVNKHLAKSRQVLLQRYWK